MKRILCMTAIVLVGYGLPLPIAAQTKQVQTAQEQPGNYEIWLVRSAERLMIAELTRGKSTSLRNSYYKCVEMCSTGYVEKNPDVSDRRIAQNQCSATCAHPGLGERVELSTALLGLATSEIASDALVRLLGVSGYSVDIDCAIVVRGKSLRSRLVDLDAAKVAESCRSNFEDLRKRELKNVTDVFVEQVCLSETEIERHRDEMLKAIDRGALCGPDDPNG